MAPVPAVMRRKYLMRSRDRSDPRVRIVPELRATVEFRRLNFMDSSYGLSEAPQVIFCRNALIYFDRATRRRPSCASWCANWRREDTCSSVTRRR